MTLRITQGFSKSATLLLMLSALTACKQKNVDNSAINEATQLPSTAAETLFHTERLNGHKAIQLNEQRYIGNSENLGLFLFDDKNNVLASTFGNYEGLDIRLIGQATYAAAINKESGNAELFIVQHDSIKAIQSLELDNTTINNLCLYQPNQNELQLILLTNKHTIEQRLLIDDLNQPANFNLIRELPAPPHSSACAVNDDFAQLFVAEETVGIWQYPLNPEDELQRQAVVLNQPHGNLEGEIKDLSITPANQLIVSLPEMSKLLVLQQAQNSWREQWITLNQGSEPESASFNDNSQLVWFDNSKDSYMSQNITLAQDSNLPTATPLNRQLSQVKAYSETQPVSHFGDAADDPAIWPNIKSPEQSKILGTDKSSGLYVYNMNGEVSQFIATGRVNNVDISFGFDWQGETIDLAAASNRTLNAISLYGINASGHVTQIGDIPTTLPDVYGLCSYRSPIDDQHYVYINDESGRFQQYRISGSANKITGELVREFAVPSQPEGCVADVKTQMLYLGEEDAGVWRIGAEPSARDFGKEALQLVLTIDNEVLFDDVEGLSIYNSDEQDVLVVSSQGNNSYVLYDLSDLSLLGRFHVTANYQRGIDGASETDGLAVSSFNFGSEFPQGMLVVQDGRNVMPTQPQNFKLINWQDIKNTLAL